MLEGKGTDRIGAGGHRNAPLLLLLAQRHLIGSHELNGIIDLPQKKKEPGATPGQQHAK